MFTTVCHFYSLKEILREVKVKDSSTYFDTFFLVLARFPAYKNVLCKTMFYNKKFKLELGGGGIEILLFSLYPDSDSYGEFPDPFNNSC